MSLGIVLLSVIVIELFVLWRLRFDAVVMGIVLAGTLSYVHYATYTSVGERNYDAASHIEYIQSIAASLRAPDVSSCVACGHPPLYYVLGAFWSKALQVVGFTPLELGLQWLSLLLFSAFIVLSLLVFRSCTRQLASLRLATLLVVFWPACVIHSIRVHNDALATPLMLAAMYFTAQWDKHGRAIEFAAALVFSALALMTKASGYAVATALLFFTALRLRSTEARPGAFKRLMVAAFALGTTASLTLALRASTTPRTPCQIVLGSACNGRYVPPLPDSPARFLSFQLRAFVGRLAIAPEDPFLNRFAKSSLFGAMPLGEPFTDRRHELLARFICWGLLAMVTVCLVGLPFLDRASLRRNRVYLGSAAIMGFYLVAFRLRAPNEFHEDFRHIFAALPLLCLGYATVIVQLGRHSKLLYYGGVALALLMVTLCVAFFGQAHSA